MKRFFQALAFAALICGFPAAARADHCVEFPDCKGCGCKGGPGYRGPDNTCVGYTALARTCGTPPTLRCTFENAPNAGINEACVREHRARRSAPSARP